MKRAILCSLWFVFYISLRANAGLVVNEVLANEPGQTRSLEWIELYSTSAIGSLDFYQIRIDDSNSFGLSGTLGADEYLVICRDSARFEGFWGDSSGVWGDAPEESYQIREEASIRLDNEQGVVAVFALSDLESQLNWTESGQDGYSWERVNPQSDQIEQSVAPSGSSPGVINSLTPVPVDLALEDVAASSEDGLTTIAFTIVNRGQTLTTDDTLHLFSFDSAAPDSTGGLVASEAVGELDTGFTVILIGRYQLPGIYQQLVARLNDDNRNNNNRYDFTAPGEDYPPVIISELLANPTAVLGSEWVELKNISLETIDLAGWELGDSVGLVTVATIALRVEPDDYMVLVQDSLGFLSFYSSFAGDCHQPTQWREFNNAGGDMVRLVDSFGIRADWFEYANGFENNYTWSRSESEDHPGEWGRSENPGGSPGQENQVRLSAEGSTSFEITIEPRIFSPDGDGRNDSTVIIVRPPDAGAYTLEVYDSQGRLVRVFEDGAADLSERYIWRGLNDSGERLPIGIYILFVEASGVQSIKKTIVIAR